MTDAEFKPGDIVTLDSYTSMGQSALGQSDGPDTVSDVRYMYDEETGEKYQQIKVGRSWYDARSGGCVSNPESMYYVVISE